MVKYCNNCGSAQGETNKFCDNCGQKFEEKMIEQSSQEVKKVAPAAYTPPENNYSGIYQAPEYNSAAYQMPEYNQAGYRAPEYNHQANYYNQADYSASAGLNQGYSYPNYPSDYPYSASQPKKSGCLTVLAIILVIILIIELAVAAFLYPGFLKKSKQTTQLKVSPKIESSLFIEQRE